MKFLFDLGGVFFDWDPIYFYQDIFNNKNELNFFLKNICNNNWNSKQDRGRFIKDAEIELINKYPKYSKEIYMYYKNHRKMIKKVFSETVAVLKKLKNKNFECYVLSNWSSETFNGMIDEYPFLNLFNGMVISGDVNMIKPNKNIYNFAIKKFNLKPHETIFIDDRIENIKTAKNLGFKTIHFTTPSSLKIKIKSYL